jgi:hypothetical protein
LAVFAPLRENNLFFYGMMVNWVLPRKVLHACGFKDADSFSQQHTVDGEQFFHHHKAHFSQSVGLCRLDVSWSALIDMRVAKSVASRSFANGSATRRLPVSNRLPVFVAVLSCWKFLRGGAVPPAHFFSTVASGLP